MSEIEDYYELLALSRQATAEQIRKAYRRLVRRLHPDIAGPAGTEKFLRVRAAYETLIDPQRRQAYDQQLQAARRRARQAKAASVVWMDDAIVLDWARSSRATQGTEADPRSRAEYVEVKPVRVEVVVSPEMADVGGVVYLDLPLTIVCGHCGGTGRAEPLVCPTCRGRGRWSQTRRVSLTLRPPVRDGQVLAVQVDQADLPIPRLLVHIRMSWY